MYFSVSILFWLDRVGHWCGPAEIWEHRKIFLLRRERGKEARTGWQNIVQPLRMSSIWKKYLTYSWNIMPAILHWHWQSGWSLKWSLPTPQKKEKKKEIYILGFKLFNFVWIVKYKRKDQFRFDQMSQDFGDWVSLGRGVVGELDVFFWPNLSALGGGVGGRGKCYDGPGIPTTQK